MRGAVLGPMVGLVGWFGAACDADPAPVGDLDGVGSAGGDSAADIRPDEPGAAPDERPDAGAVTAGPCAGAPITTWDNFGQGFLRANCQGCHAHAAPDRHGAPQGIAFDTLNDVRMWAARIGTTAASEAPTMPPAGGVREADRSRLGYWLRCSPEFASEP